MEKLATTLLETTETQVAASRIIPVITPLLTDEPILLKVSAAATANAEALVLADTRVRKKPSTQKIREADESRDNAFRALRDFIAVWAGSPVATEAQKSAAAGLQAIIEKHGTTLYDLPDDKQTGKMEALFTDLNSASATADLETLNLAALYLQMKNAQATFEQLVTAGQTDDLPLVGDHAPALRRRLNLLLSVIAEWKLLDPPAEVTAAVEQLDAIIVDIMTPVRARQTRKKTPARI